MTTNEKLTIADFLGAKEALEKANIPGNIWMYPDGSIYSDADLKKMEETYGKPRNTTENIGKVGPDVQPTGETGSKEPVSS